MYLQKPLSRFRLPYLWLFGWLWVIVLIGFTPAPASANPTQQTTPDKIAAGVLAQAQNVGSVRVIVGLNVAHQPEGNLSGAQVSGQRQSIQQAQGTLVSSLSGFSLGQVKAFDTIPYIAMRVDQAGLQALQASGLVTHVYEDRQLSLFLENSNTLIGSSLAWQMGYDGTGQAVAVLDTGVDSSHPFFSGRVVAEGCFTTQDTDFTPTCPNGLPEQTGPGSGVNCELPIQSCYHGSHVAGIAAGSGRDINGVARNANIIAIQVTSQAACGIGVFCPVPNFSDVIRGLEYVADLANTHDIASVNLSLGTTAVFAGTCDADFPAEKAAVDTLVSLGIAVIAASGNGDSSGVGYTNGISSPACLSNTVSVGAISADPTTSDRFAPFSNSSSVLDLLAPGWNIFSAIAPNTISGNTNWMESAGGTSMAAPQVAGAWAVLKQAAPSATIAQILAALKNTGVPLTDPRNSIVTPRLQVDAAAASLTGATLAPPANDTPANAALITDLSYTRHLLTRTATTQGGLPALPGNCGGGSASNDVWYRYTATSAQTITLQTDQSGFDTVLAVWTNATTAPSLVACSDNISGSNNRSRLTFNTTPGTTYYFQAGGRGANGMLRFDAGLGLSNDDIANAKVIDGLIYRDTLNTVDATAVGDPQPGVSCLDADIAKSVWYKYTAGAEEYILLDTFGSYTTDLHFNTVISVWTGTPGNLTLAACHDDVFWDFLYYLLDPAVLDLTSRLQFRPTAGTTYYIMVSGKDALLTSYPQGGELKFNMTLVFAPFPAPTLVAPANNASVSNGQPVFSWNSVRHIDGYEFQLGGSNPPGNAPIVLYSPTYTPSSPLLDTTWFWRVRAVDGTLRSDWSAPRQLTIQSPASLVPIRNLYTTLSPTLTWNNITWAAAYQVQVATNSRFTAASLVHDEDDLTGLATTLNLSNPGRYYWRVRAQRANGRWGAWSAVDTFSITLP